MFSEGEVERYDWPSIVRKRCLFSTKDLQYYPIYDNANSKVMSQTTSGNADVFVARGGEHLSTVARPPSSPS